MMSRPDSDFYTPEMDQAERELDARIDYALDVAGDVRAQVEEFERKLDAEEEPPSDEDVERIKNFVLGHARTEEWQRVIEMINRGDLSWREVVDSFAAGRLDHRVAAAFASLSRVPPASMEKLVEIGVFPASLPEDTPAAPADDAEDEPPAQDERTKYTFDVFAAQDDEDWEHDRRRR
jgi:hypothetical protein